VSGKPTVRIRGRSYPVLLPTPRDPRLHLAAVIVSLQVLGQVAFEFRLSIAQILVALGTSAVLEAGIAFRRQHVIMWPASALLTGNGVAFVLRVPGTEHGQWWSLRGWWIFAATAGISLLSKHVIQLRGRHVFNPSNFGLVLCFLALGSSRAEPLDFWWAPMSTWMALALGIIVAGGLAILTRLRLLEIAVGFWVAFAAAIGVLAATGHAMTARWHLGPITGGYFWWVLLTSPELLVFLFFMITDPKTIPAGRRARMVYAVSIGLVAALLIAPQRTEFGSKVALLGALALVCAVRPLLAILPRVSLLGRRTSVGLSLAGAAAFVGVLVAAGIPARPATGTTALAATNVALPHVTIERSHDVASQIDRRTATQVARDVVAELRLRADAQIRAGASAELVPRYDVEQIRLRVEPGVGQGPPTVVCVLHGMILLGSAAKPKPFTKTLELRLDGSRFRIVGPTIPSAPRAPVVSARVAQAAARGFAGVRLVDVAPRVGLRFRQDAFRFGVDRGDPAAMMGGGLCWLDYNDDGWLDLFVVNSYSDADIGRWDARGGLPRSTLFENVHGRFVNVGARSHADPAIRGNGCVAADFNGDGRTDVYVTSASDDVLLWNNGNGTFSEGARAAGIASFGWHSGAAVADVNGDGRPDLFVAGYTNVNAPLPASQAGFPTNHTGVCSELFLNLGNGAHGRARFREVGAAAGLPQTHCDHSLGAVFTDVNGDGRPDLYVANDEDPNRLYVNVPRAGGAKADPRHLGFRLVDRARLERVADRNAGMGVAAADYNGDGRPDLFVSNSRGQEHAVFSTRPGGSFADARPAFATAFGQSFTGWGDSWVDLNRDGYPDLVLANGAIPVTNLRKDAAPVQVLENLTAQGLPGEFANAGRLVGVQGAPRVNGRGLAAADFDNDGNVDVAINSIGGPLVLLENRNTAGHWLEVSLRGFHPGATVTAELPDGRRLVRTVQAGSSYLSSEDPRLFFGLGKATSVRSLVVRYPGGKATRLRRVAADRILDVKS
jgi:hypothetical protein